MIIYFLLYNRLFSLGIAFVVKLTSHVSSYKYNEKLKVSN